MHGGVAKHIPFEKLDISSEDITERLAQFWACAQCRILSTFQLFIGRGTINANSIPYHLRPNKVLQVACRAAWINDIEDYSDDDSSDVE